MTVNAERKTSIFPLHWVLLSCALCCVSPVAVNAGDRLVVQLKDFSRAELKSGGFVLAGETKLQIWGKGASGDRNNMFNKSDMFAYGWIINASSREVVWQMTRSNTSKEGKERVFNADVTLPRGSYEAYYCAYAFNNSSSFSSYNYNVDPRHPDGDGKKGSEDGWFHWFGDLFGENFTRDWKRRSQEWGIDIRADDSRPEITLFSVPREIPNVLYKATKLGENEHVRQPFTLANPLAVRIYAIGEMARANSLQDYAWIVNTKTHKRVWEMKGGNVQHAGGAEKNVEFNDIVSLPAGDYSIYYTSDDSHSFLDWNSAPPDDPFNYGVTLIAPNPNDKGVLKLASGSNEEKNVIVQIVRVRDDQTTSATFLLKEDAQVHVYALGEVSPSHREMTDFGWILNAKTRQKVWTMDYDRTEHAGGAEKNRMIDESVSLPKGEYTVVFQSDDSHSYDDWNDSPPFDPEHWGITITGEGDAFKMADVELNPSAHATGVIAQIVQVGDNAKRKISFSLSHPTRVRIYAMGEGQNKEMFDYGWIENSTTQSVVWEMTYSMTFHAGGGRKNRMVNTTMLLDKGEYNLHYVSDDSHSYNDWNTEPPDDPTMWGITVMEEKE